MTTQISGDIGVSAVQPGSVSADDFNAALFAASLTGNGYQKLPSGLIIQWVNSTNTVNIDTPIAVNWPIPFPNACLFSTYAWHGASINGNMYLPRGLNLSDAVVARCTVSSINLQDITGMFFGVGY